MLDSFDKDFNAWKIEFIPNSQPNGQGVIIIVDIGKIIGTKSETKIKIVIGVTDGKVWTAYPVN